jgi:hypothetical protein
MITINPEREARRLGKPTDPLRLFADGFQLTARCRRPGCEHSRALVVGLLVKAFGPDATLERVSSRLRCSACGMQGARIEVKYTGRRCDGR